MPSPNLTEEARGRIIQLFEAYERMTLRGAAEIVGVDWRDVRRVRDEWRASRAPGEANPRAVDRP